MIIRTVFPLVLGLFGCVAVYGQHPHHRGDGRNAGPGRPPAQGDGGGEKGSHDRVSLIRKVQRPERIPDRTVVFEPEARELDLDENRTIDGTHNNEANPSWGSEGQLFLRLTEATYADGIGEPAVGPNARMISNLVLAQDEDNLASSGTSDFLWQWGQFLDHDITETPVLDPLTPFNISVPLGDPSFDPFSTGTREIPLNRSYSEPAFGVEQQLNAITAFIDGSNVYGSDEERAAALREGDGSGRLKVTPHSTGDLLPYNTDGLHNAPSTDGNFFLAGDVRANEQVGLTAMHTLFVREHNYWADSYRSENSGASGDEIYEYARKIVSAEMQVITYEEFLPLLLGGDAIPRYRGYRPNVNPGISNEFATAAYRLGHSLLSPELLRVDSNGREIDEGHLSLAEAFFRPDHIEEVGIESVLRGLAAQNCQELDAKVIDEVRNFLFGAPGSGGLDLASLNIQRGRDHSLGTYNDARRAMGLRPVTRFGQITRDRDLASALDEAYSGDVEQIDLWVGGLSESHLPGAMVGETFHRILANQFIRLRDGDRFWYEIDLSRDLVRLVQRQTLAEIIRRNTSIGREISDNVFLVRSGSLRRPR